MQTPALDYTGVTGGGASVVVKVVEMVVVVMVVCIPIISGDNGMNKDKNKHKSVEKIRTTDSQGQGREV